VVQGWEALEWRVELRKHHESGAVMDSTIIITVFCTIAYLGVGAFAASKIVINEFPFGLCLFAWPLVLVFFALFYCFAVEGDRKILSGLDLAVARRRVMSALLALSALLVILATAPVSADAKAPPLKCAHFSVSAIAKVVGTGPLKLAAPEANSFCSYEGNPLTGFLPFLSVHLSHATQSIFSLSEKTTKKLAAAQGAKFATLKIGSAQAWYVASVAPEGLGRPNEIEITVGAYGPYKSSNSKIVVGAGVAAQVGVGNVTVSHMTLLVKEILSGQIH
jgi:hypothetical protein